MHRNLPGGRLNGYIPPCGAYEIVNINRKINF